MQGKSVPGFYETVTPEPYTDDDGRPLAASDDGVYVVFDTETTGLCSSPFKNMDRIIEMGACKIVGGKITETFSSLINPQRELPWYITDVTGITDRMVRGAPTYEKVLSDFYKFCDGACLVGHNIDSFDMRFLDYYWEELGFVREHTTIDTLKLARRVRPGLLNYKLPTIAAAYGYTFGDGRTHHRALDDAIITAKIFLDMKAWQNL